MRCGQVLRPRSKFSMPSSYVPLFTLGPVSKTSLEGGDMVSQNALQENIFREGTAGPRRVGDAFHGRRLSEKVLRIRKGQGNRLEQFTAGGERALYDEEDEAQEQDPGVVVEGSALAIDMNGGGSIHNVGRA